eukprot:jgi/Orpsp1_1/1175916/evm.model.c7180000055710.1
MKMNVKRFIIICQNKVMMMIITRFEDGNEIEIFHFNFKSGLNFDSLKNLKKLKVLDISWFNDNVLRSVPEFVYSLITLKQLIIRENKITSISDSLGNLKNLELLDLSNNRLTKFPAKLSELKNLKILNLGYNNINDELPGYLNSFSNLEEIDLNGNENIKGKTLTNPSLNRCYYSKEYSLCIAKDNDCFISTNHMCGKGYGRCPAGECCSKYGWCGRSEKHCLVEAGCQFIYGECKTSSPIDDRISSNGKCGGENGKCPSGQCCSKGGECGTSEDHCSVDAGCQIGFGKCKNDKISINGQCGLADGKCPEGKCCSKYG